MNVVNFYLKDSPFGEFSNFASFPIELDGNLWPTTEHYFQAQKFEDEVYRELVREARTPMQAARLGRDRSKTLRADWESIKDDVMRKAVFAKFTQHVNLRELLLATGTAAIVEHTERDSYWGDGGNGTGKNMLGRILVETRERLRQEVTPPTI